MESNTRKSLLVVVSAIAVCLSAGCASVDSFSLTQVPADRSRPITAEASDWSFLGINFSNDFVDEIRPQLLEQCPDGDVRGVLTKHESTLYVLILTREVEVTAYCVPSGGGGAASAPETPSAPDEGGR